LSNDRFDDFHIRKIYHTKNGGEEWFMDHENEDVLEDDERVKNWRDDDGNNKVGLRSLGNNKWEAKGTSDKKQLRLEVWSPKEGNEDEQQRSRWLNVEITAYCRVDDTSGNPPYAWQLYCRGGSHRNNHRCEGSALKARWRRRNNKVHVIKEICHGAYTEPEAEERDRRVEKFGDGKWYGAKLIVYNVEENGSTHTKQEVWVDETTDSGDAKNTWEMVTEYVDNGGWEVEETEHEEDDDFKRHCRDNNNCDRERDEILTKPGGRNNRNCVALRTDKVTIHFKHLSCREIDPSKRVS
jgi:hypothetical protein